MSWKILGGIIGAALIFGAGYKYAAALYQADIDALKADHALALANAEKEHRANERKQSEALSQAWDAYEKAKAELAESRADSGSLRTQLERVRVEADSYRKRLSRAGANPCKHFVERLGECVGLLEEGSGLSEEGASLSQRLSAKHDAVVRLHSSN